MTASSMGTPVKVLVECRPLTCFPPLVPLTTRCSWIADIVPNVGLGTCVLGELVLLTRRVDNNWFEGRIGNRKGIFPVSYVDVLVEPGERASEYMASVTQQHNARIDVINFHCRDRDCDTYQFSHILRLRKCHNKRKDYLAFWRQGHFLCMSFSGKLFHLG